MDEAGLTHPWPAVLWDVDGTLVDSEPLHEEALIMALDKVGLRPPADFHRHIIGRDAKDVHAWCRDRLGLDLPLHEWLTLKYQTYLASAPDLRAREGAVDLFKRLRADGYAQAIVSNSDRILVQANLEAMDLIEPGQIVVTRNDVRHGKPTSEPYRRAAWLLAVEPADCLVVEDSMTGAEAGIAAGMRTLFWPETTLPTPEGAELVENFVELERLIKKRRQQ